MQVGRIVYVLHGQNKDKLGAVTEVVDHNRAVVDGPGMKREVISFRNLELTEFLVPIERDTRPKHVLKAFEQEKVTELFSKTKRGLQIQKRKLRSSLGDFDRFKLMKLKQKRRALK